MTNLEKSYMLELNTRLDEALLNEIYFHGFSRIPIYKDNKQNVIGLLMAKDLLLLNPKDKILSIKQLSDIFLRDVVAIDADSTLEETMREFKKSKTHLGVVTRVMKEDDKDPYIEIVGIVTFEDLIEEILQEEIEDE